MAPPEAEDGMVAAGAGGGDVEVTVRGDSFILQDVGTASGLQRTVRGYILTVAKRVGLMSSVLAVNNKNNNDNNGRRKKL